MTSRPDEPTTPTNTLRSSTSPSLITRLRIASVALLAGFLLLGVIAVWTAQSLTHALDNAIYEVDREAVPLLSIAGDVRSTIFLFQESLNGDRAHLDRVIEDINVDISALTGNDAPRLDEEAGDVEAAVAEWSEIETSLHEMTVDFAGPMDPRLEILFAQINTTADHFAAAHATAMEDTRRETMNARDIRNRSLVLLAATIAAMGAGGLVLVRREGRLLTSSLRPLRAGAERVSRGEFDEAVPAVGAAEFVELAAAFNQMAGEIQERESRLSYRALHDPLTDLGNRAMLGDRLTSALSRLRRHPDENVAVLFIDLDGFKRVNDTLGHAAGDEAIRAAAERIAQCMRGGETLARLGGDEFAVIAEDVRGNASALAERVRQVLTQPYFLGGSRVTLSASIGIVEASTGIELPEDLLRNADLAMYAAKAAGGDQIRVYRDVFRTDAIELAQVEEELRDAIEGGELLVYYQPTFTLEPRHLSGVEALVRWQHPRRGLLLPDEFIPIAERSGLIVPLGAYVLQQAMSDFVHWEASHPTPDHFSLSVNVSARQLSTKQFADVVKGLLESTGMPASDLILEVTETQLLSRDAFVREQLDRLRATGVRIALDDFGTGYTTLQYLRSMPVDIVKIDRAFVTGLARRDDLSAIVATILNLARAFELGVVAEGIEDMEDATALMLLGCESGQGFALARPTPASAIEDLLDSTP